MATQHILQVSELTKKVRFILESELNTVWLCGEISNFIAASSGHWYLSLKDNKSQVRCAMFKGANRRVRLKPQNGQQVLVRAKVSLYEPRGDFQLIIEQMEDAGEGLLRQQYQQLKDALNREGLFSLAHKQAIPTTIKTVGIITSPTGAAVKDILTVLNRRNPMLNVIIYPALVQGEQAKFDISRAIVLANTRRESDVLIVGRGGGSLEDLWAFNEEQVARAIFNSQIPIISAVGHEVDTALSDYVADLRAATPSAAAELVSNSLEDEVSKNQQLLQRITYVLNHKIKRISNQVTTTNHRLAQVDPKQQLQVQQQKNDELSLRLHQAINRLMTQLRHTPLHLQERLLLSSPERKLNSLKQNLTVFERRLGSAQHHLFHRKAEAFSHLCEQLNLVSPLATIARGYSVTRNVEGKIVNQVKDVAENDSISIEVKDGLINAVVTSRTSN